MHKYRTTRRRQGGFNFAEVLFAVMILGIGFIMVAAMFPVAVVQVKMTQDETTAASIARGGANFVEQIAIDRPTPTVVATNIPRLPATGGQVRALDEVPAVRGAMTLPSDPRYAWVPFYRRSGTPDDTAPFDMDDWGSYAQVYMVPVAVRNRSDYKAPPTVLGTLTGTGTKTASLVANIIDSSDTTNNPTGEDIIEFPAGEGENDTNDNYTTVTDGCYVIVANATAPVGAAARTGHIFRIGGPTDQQPNGSTGHPRRWTLVPGNDYVPLRGDWDNDGTFDDTNEDPGPLQLDGATVFVVGRGLADPTAGPSANNLPEGTAQDVGAYVTFVQIR